MKSITTLENIPDSLDIQEMMDVKGGAEINAIYASLPQQLNALWQVLEHALQKVLERL